MMRLLIQNGAVINALTAEGRTPMGIAKRRNFTSAVELLKASGATE
jgi:ankyrin repeat protein